jgi:hypothetical protein
MIEYRSLVWCRPTTRRRGIEISMGRHEKLLLRILSGTSDAGIQFEALRGMLFWLGFDERIKGDHHIFTRPDIPEILNLQPKGSGAKAYQVKQVRNVIITHGLGVDPDEA